MELVEGHELAPVLPNILNHFPAFPPGSVSWRGLGNGVVSVSAVTH